MRRECAYHKQNMQHLSGIPRLISLAQKSTLRLSVVVPAYNEEQNIVACLHALEQQIVPVHEIIVVDNRSTDRTAALVNEFQTDYPHVPLVLLAQHEVQGLIPTRNVGFANVTGDIIGRIDADSRVLPHWSAAVITAFTASDISAVTGPVSYYDMPLERFNGKVDHYARRVLLSLGKEYHFLFGSNMALRTSAWEAIRDAASRDEDDLLHEDIDIAMTLQRHGYTVGYEKHMAAAISSRRIDTPKRDFYHYVGRFGRTYDAHGVKKWHLQAPPAVLKASYWPLRTIHRTNRAVTAYRTRRQRRVE